MPPDRKSQHKLAAILFADIVGYTALMEQGEGKAMSILARFEEVTNQKVAAHDGEIIKTYGDGSLILFDSTVDAVQCAHDIQLALREEPVVPLRIGIHVGEMVRKGNDVFGNGVNIASRVESMGVAGSVLLSKDAQKRIKNQETFETASLGIFDFKNVEEPMEVFALTNNGFAVPKQMEKKGKTKELHRHKPKRVLIWLLPLLLIGFTFGMYQLKFGNSMSPGITQEKPSIVVLAFDNLNQDPEQEYFSDGIADEIRNSLSAIDRLKVISRTSSMYFKGKNVPVKEIAESLKINHILSGSVFKYEDQLKISVELSNAHTDEVEWSLNTESLPLEDIFDIQREIGLEVAKQLRINLNQQEIDGIFKQYTNDPEIHDQFLKAWSKIYTKGFNDLEETEADLLAILNHEPDHVPALMTLAYVHVRQGIVGLPRDSVKIKALPLFLKAEQLNDGRKLFMGSFAIYKFWYDWDFEGAAQIANRGIEVNDEISIIIQIDMDFKTGNLERAGKLIQKLEDINPLSYGTFMKGQYLLSSGKDQEAEKFALAYINNANAVFSFFVYTQLGSLYLKQGRNQEAVDILELGIEKTGQSMPFLSGHLAIAYHRMGQIEKFDTIVNELESLWESRASGSPAFFLGAIYSSIGAPDKAFDWLEKSFELRDVEMLWLKMDPRFEPVKNDPRYLDLLDRVGFPKVLKN